MQSCTIKSHYGTCIDSVFINIVCKATSRMVCSMCIRDKIHGKDKIFMMSQYKYDDEINEIKNPWILWFKKTRYLFTRKKKWNKKFN